MTDTPLVKLRARRRRSNAQLDKLEPMVAGYRAMLRDVNAAIPEIDSVASSNDHQHLRRRFAITNGDMKPAAVLRLRV